MFSRQCFFECIHSNKQTSKPLPLSFALLGIYNFVQLFGNPPYFFLSSAFTRKARAELVSILPRSKFGPIYLAASFFEGVHSNKTNKHISPSPYCLEYLVTITLCSFLAILHVSSSPMHSQERPGQNWFLFSLDPNLDQFT